MLIVVPALALNIVGTNGNNVLRGSAQADTINGRGGNDRILGLAGNDRLTGGSGRDVLDGGAGNDRLLIRDGARDTATCGGGRDSVTADAADVVRSDCEAVSRPTSPSPSPSPTPPPSLPGVLDVLETPGQAWDLAIGGGAAWVQVGDTGAVRIDRTTKSVTTRVENVTALAFLGDTLWAAADDRMLQLDPSSGAVLATIPVPRGAFHIGTGADAVWVSGGGSVQRIDPVSKQAIAIPVPTCGGQRTLTVGHGSVWHGCRDSGAVVRIDVATNSVVATIPTGLGASHIAVGTNAVWVTNYQVDTVSRIDPATNGVVATIRPAGGGLGIAVGDGVVWAADSLGIKKIDPSSNTVRGEIRLPAARYHYDIQLVDGSLWVSSTDNRVYRIDPAA